MSEQMKSPESSLPSDSIQEKQLEESRIPSTEEKPKKKQKKKRRGVPLLLVIILLLLMFTAGTVVGAKGITYLAGSASGIDNDTIMKKLSLLETCVSQYFLDDVDEEELEEGIYRGFMDALDDPYSTYYSATEYKQLMDEDSGEYKGIGVTVSKDKDTNYAEVMSVFKGDPAYNAGVKTGDFIMKVNDKDTSSMTLTEVVTEIKSSDDPVLLSIYREGEQLEISVEKSTISVDSVTYEMKENQFGYVSISQFLENTDEQFEEAVDDLTSQGMKGLVIDLRDNGGGLLDSCVNMVSRIIPEGDLIVYTQDKSGNRTDYNSNSEKTLDLPIVLLVNENTASASEIMTGCLKDYSLATVIGTTTYGKGIVQSIIPLSDGSALKLTVSAYYTPNGVNIHKVGIEPDETMEMTDEEWKEALEDPSKDAQLARALEILKEKNEGK